MKLFITIGIWAIFALTTLIVAVSLTSCSSETPLQIAIEQRNVTYVAGQDSQPTSIR